MKTKDLRPLFSSNIYFFSLSTQEKSKVSWIQDQCLRVKDERQNQAQLWRSRKTLEVTTVLNLTQERRPSPLRPFLPWLLTHLDFKRMLSRRTCFCDTPTRDVTLCPRRKGTLRQANSLHIFGFKGTVSIHRF